MARTGYVYPLASVWDYRKFLFFAGHVEDLAPSPQRLVIHGGAIFGQDLALVPQAERSEPIALAGQPVLLVSSESSVFEELLASFGLTGMFVETSILAAHHLAPQEGPEEDPFSFQNAARLSPGMLESMLLRSDRHAAALSDGSLRPHVNAPCMGPASKETALSYDPRGDAFETPWGDVLVDLLEEQADILERVAEETAHPYDKAMLNGVGSMLREMREGFYQDDGEES